MKNGEKVTNMNQIIDQLNALGNINPVDFNGLKAALQAMQQVASTTGVTFAQTGTALKTVANRLKSVKTYEEEHYLTIYGNQTKKFKTIYGILEEKEE